MIGNPMAKWAPMIPKTILLIFLSASSIAAAREPIPKLGSFGFNWLNPDSRCRKLTRKDIEALPGCRVNANAFGLEGNALSCRVDRRTEWMVYETATRCRAALDTMQANGP